MKITNLGKGEKNYYSLFIHLLHLKMKQFAILLIGFLIVFSSCDDEIDSSVIDYKYEYFPLTIGESIIYDVDSIIYSSLSGGGILKDSIQYELRETVADTFRDNTNRLIYEIERERRDSASMLWRLEEVLTVHQGQTQLEWTENNRKFLKILFPPKVDDTWDGNMYFDATELVPIKGEVIELFKSWESSVAELDIPMTINNFSSDSTLTIYHANSENLIELRLFKEVYAKNIGLIQQETMILDTQCITDCIGQTWEEKAEKGFILRKTIQ
jgi:hypothetical protein